MEEFHEKEDAEIGEKVDMAEFITTGLEMGLSLTYDRMKTGE